MITVTKETGFVEYGVAKEMLECFAVKIDWDIDLSS
jgi:hypothetical protein